MASISKILRKIFSLLKCTRHKHAHCKGSIDLVGHVTQQPMNIFLSIFHGIIDSLMCNCIVINSFIHLFYLSIRLYVEKLPKHPGYSKAPPADKSRVKKLIGPALDQALELKKKLKQKYEQEKEIYSRQVK